MKAEKEPKPDPKKTFGKISVEFSQVKGGGVEVIYQDLDSSQTSDDVNSYSAKRSRKLSQKHNQKDTFSGLKLINEREHDSLSYKNEMDVDRLSRRISNMGDLALGNLDTLSVLSEGGQGFA